MTGRVLNEFLVSRSCEIGGLLRGVGVSRGKQMRGRNVEESKAKPLPHCFFVGSAPASSSVTALSGEHWKGPGP